VRAGRLELAAGDASATLAPDEGGMLVSLRVAGHEVLVSPRDAAGPVPTYGSFLMAPWVGELSCGQLDFRGQHVQFPLNLGRHAIHGLVASAPWDVETADRSSAWLARELPAPWPFGGTAAQHIALDAHGITLEAEVRSGDEALPAALGWHPWFACPDPAIVRLRVQADFELELDDELLPTGRIHAVAGDSDLRGGPFLGTRRLDTVFVGAVSPAVLDLGEIQLKIHFDPAIEVLVVYTSDGSVCVEPWSAWPDAFRMAAAGHPSGVAVLEPGESLRRWTRWEWSVKEHRHA
jgi:aldose 1-epimerase